MVGSVQLRPAKSLVDIRKPVVQLHPQHRISASTPFGNQIRNTSIDPNNTLFCSFDIVSLFTKIPLYETIAICVPTLYQSHLDPSPSVPEPILLKLILNAAKRMQFTFNNTMYQQTDGINMGIPLGATLANIFVRFPKARLFKITTLPLFYKRYVDDTFVIFSLGSKRRGFFNTITQLHPGLTFTCEFVHSNSLLLLDLWVERTNLGLRTLISRKPTFTRSYTWCGVCLFFQVLRYWSGVRKMTYHKKLLEYK